MPEPYPYEPMQHELLGRIPGARRIAWTESPVRYVLVSDDEGPQGALWVSADGAAGFLAAEGRDDAADVWNRRLAMAHAEQQDPFDGYAFLDYWLSTTGSGEGITLDGPHDANNSAAVASLV